MTHDDRMAALALANEPPSKVRSDANPDGVNIGGLGFKKTEGNPLGQLATQLMQRNNGTFVWDMKDEINGLGAFDNIHQYAAAEMYAPGGSLRARIEASQEHESAARYGFNTLSKWLVDVWGVPLFRLTEPGSGNKITVITVRPDYEDPHTGKLAKDLLLEKDAKQIKGQMGTIMKRWTREFGETMAASMLQHALDTQLQLGVAPPIRKQLNKLPE